MVQDDSPDATRLAMTVMEGASEAEVNRAMERLVPVIRENARLMTGNLNPRAWRHELIEEVSSVVWSKLRRGTFDPQKGRFEPWCRSVLRNWVADRVRARRRDRLAGAVSLDPEAGIDPADYRPSWQDLATRSELLGTADLNRIRQWTATDRVLLLCLSGLHLRVPTPEWRGWLSELDLVEPFPPESYPGLETKSERYTSLAESLKLSNNAVAQRVRRGRRLLLSLDVLDPREGRFS